MKKVLFFLTAFVGSLALTLTGQNIELTFTGDNNGQPVSLTSVVIKNLTQNCDTTIYPPDFILVIDTILTGISSNGISDNAFSISQNFPNPFTDQTAISLSLPEDNNVEISVSNLLGQQVSNYHAQLKRGRSDFIFFPGDDKVYLLSVIYNKEIRTIRMISAGRGTSAECHLKYQGTEGSETFKSVQLKSFFDYNPGDNLLFVGHTSGEESGILDSPKENQNYVFQFASNVPCPGLDSLFYDGKYYHTIQIFSQCWMKENMDAGIMIQGSQSPSNNGVIEKYCYSNNLNNCAAKGGLYIWEEMMQYTTDQGAQGICPEGWHIPTDEEWKILEAAADSQYGIGHPIWNNANSFRGLDAGKNLKSATGWSANGNGLDIYGFTAISGGYWWQNAFFENTNFGIYWTSTLNSQSLPWYRGFRMDMNNVARFTFDSINGYSVRCLKDQ
jgi:uncharacterized protein (TIGR02145 family)